MHWKPFEPSEREPWNLRRVHHLHRRAGLGANWGVLQSDLRDGPHAAVARFIQADPAVEDFDLLQRLIGDAAVSSGDMTRLKAWWFYHILSSGDPLTERMSLMWHNHFATSNLKVANVAMMRRQNDRIRQHATGKFGDLLKAVVKHAAMLTWLDADVNRKGKPNENLARELMELFTLGVGHYSESDVKEVARALTGWTIRNDDFAFVDSYHDHNKKTILGQEGDFDGDAVLNILLQQESVALRTAKRLCDTFFGEGGVQDEQLDSLARGLRDHDLDIRWAIETILHSEAFFAESNIGNRVLDPIQYMIFPLRALKKTSPPPSTLLLAEWSAKLGQDLFYPPNVFGWPGGRAWLTSRTMIARANYMNALVAGQLHRPSQPLDAEALAQKHDFTSPENQTAFLSQLLFGEDQIGDDLNSLLKSARLHVG